MLTLPQTADSKISLQAQCFIFKNICSLSTLQHVSCALDIPHSTLRRKFKAQTGITLGVYIKRARVDKARLLLIETEMPVYLVCVEVGFSGATVGNRIFKKQTQVTMIEYRKEYKHDFT